MYDVFYSKKEFFNKKKTMPYAFRIEQLKKLKHAIKKNETYIKNALFQDLNKPNYESVIHEIAIVHSEIDYAIKNLSSWARPHKVKTTLCVQPAKSFVVSDPYGVVLIISPWNYPFQLTLVPLVGAIAAGNCAVVVPSATSNYSSRIISKIINEVFSKNYISVELGDGSVLVPKLMAKFRFDYVFFTGGGEIGKKVYTSAAEKLVPVTLELGGKCPAIVDKKVNLQMAAKKIVWGKFINAGQTCVAPDYVLVDEAVVEEFISLCIKYIRNFFGILPESSDDYGRVVNEKSFERLVKIINENYLLYGGEFDDEELYISPTLVQVKNPKGKFMHEETFGPILAIIPYKTPSYAIDLIRFHENPLALYVFTHRKAFAKYFLANLRFGGGAVNDVVSNLSNPNLPFGGVGGSGIGSYHGKYSFDTFSHPKSILWASSLWEFPFRYPPYSKSKTIISSLAAMRRF